MRLSDRRSFVSNRCPVGAIKSLHNYVHQIKLRTEMIMSTKNLKTLSIALIMLLSFAAILPPTQAQQESPQRYEPESTTHAHLEAASDSGNFVIQADPQGTYCRDANREE